MNSSLSLGKSWVLETLKTAFLSGLFLKFPGGACPQISLGSSHLRRSKASCGANEISRPVLSGICPPLLKTVENPVGRLTK